MKEQLVPGTLDKLHCIKIYLLFVRQLRKKDKSLRKLASAGEPRARGLERDAPEVPSCLTLGRVSSWAAALQAHTHKNCLTAGPGEGVSTELLALRVPPHTHSHSSPSPLLLSHPLSLLFPPSLFLSHTYTLHTHADYSFLTSGQCQEYGRRTRAGARK